MNSKVNEFLSSAKIWHPEMEKLRSILLDCLLEEELKWRQPCYSHKGKNIAIIGAFKNYCIIGFFKGSLLSDSENILTAPGENSQSVRQIRFTNLEEIEKLENTIKAYIIEAIEVEKAGLKVDTSANKNLEYPEELTSKMNEDSTFKNAFESLTPGRQRAYIIFINAAKQSATKTARIEKYYSRILKGKGMNDCLCGLSKRMPNCDGSHKNLKEL